MKAASRMALLLVLIAAFPGWAKPRDWGTKHRHGGVKLSYWSAALDGEIKFTDRGTDLLGEKTEIGETLSLVDDLKIENPQGVPELILDFRPTKRNRLYLSYFQGRYRGDNNNIFPDNPIEFLGRTFTGQVGTRIQVDRVKAFYQFSPLAFKRGYLGALLGTELYLFDVTLEGRIGGTSLKKEENAVFPLVLPVVGVSGECTLLYGLGLFGQASGMHLEIMNLQATYLDLLGGVQFKVSRFYAAAGYQWLQGQASLDLLSDKTFQVDLFHQGPIAFVGLNL